MAVSPAAPDSDAPPDSLINHADAIRYWSSTPATVSGVLGGYPGLSRTDIQGSANFLAKLRRGSGSSSKKLARVVDCGAGIGRITLGLLGKVAEKVDVVEPVASFCDVVRQGKEFDGFRGHVWEAGLEAWEPFPGLEKGDTPKGEDGPLYDLIWNQWCLSQLTDKQLVAYLEKSKAWIKPGGFIIVKENLSNHVQSLDVFDETDSSVTRTREKFEAIFEQAGLKALKTELQRGFPKELYPVRMWGLQPI
ncbi:hypothetical protein ANO11243_074140 [Dothideomycetidae sp. 11243]|nr:hypothetical protein ANO11243_074140 [fungal sp. No.11243]